MAGLKVMQEIKTASIFKGEEITLYMHDAEHGYCGKKCATVRISVDEEGNFILETSPNLEPKLFECVG